MGFVPPPPPPGKGGRGRAIGLGIAVAVAVAVATPMVLGVAEEERDRQALSDVAEVIDVGDDDGANVSDFLPSSFDLAVGECYLDRSDVATADEPIDVDVTEVPCTGEHHGEVFLVTDLPEGDDVPFPGDEAVFEAASPICMFAYAGYVGQPYETSSLDFIVIYPSLLTWSRLGDREVVCAVVNIDGSPLDGVVAGSGR